MPYSKFKNRVPLKYWKEIAQDTTVLYSTINKLTLKETCDFFDTLGIKFSIYRAIAKGNWLVCVSNSYDQTLRSLLITSYKNSYSESLDKDSDAYISVGKSVWKQGVSDKFISSHKEEPRE